MRAMVLVFLITKAATCVSVSKGTLEYSVSRVSILIVAERKCNLTVLTCSLQKSKAQICKSGAISNDHRGKIVQS